MGMKERFSAFSQKLKGFYEECRRVLRVTKKPDREEYWVIVKVSGIGILAIGLFGFLVSMINQLLFK
ncbi:MAG TPA: protein translocase SEC61 complex subunit gamma [Candidatus Nanoarchaeia archaeon]|nr:protein translocase SEC61 complex subunit gamma [Candidatus Nanoarchaeia archaeon]